MLSDLIRLARPKDWIKNAFVVMPVPFALADGATLEPVPFLSGLAAMCLAGSAAYAFNDTRDAERDRGVVRPDDRRPRAYPRDLAAGPGVVGVVEGGAAHEKHRRQEQQPVERRVQPVLDAHR